MWLFNLMVPKSPNNLRWCFQICFYYFALLVQNYGNFAERLDLAYLWSCIRKSLREACKASFLIKRVKSPELIFFCNSSPWLCSCCFNFSFASFDALRKTLAAQLYLIREHVWNPVRFVKGEVMISFVYECSDICKLAKPNKTFGANIHDILLYKYDYKYIL